MQNLVLISRFAVQYSCKPSDDTKCVARCDGAGGNVLFFAEVSVTSLW